MFLLILPVLLGFMGLVIDGAHAFGEKRKSQNLADATALAAAQSIHGPHGVCPSGPPPITNVKHAAECYSEMNGGPSVLHQCDYSDPANPERPDPGEGCYTWPYKGDADRIEIRVTRSVHGFFLSAIGLGSLFDNGAFARAVASVMIEPHCTLGGVPRDDLLPDCAVPAQPGTFVPADNGDHCYVGDPPEQRDDLLPSCQLPDEPGTIINANGVDHCYVGDPSVQRDDLLPSCVRAGDVGTIQEGTNPRCEFNPPVANPDRYLNTDPPCRGPPTGGIDGAQAWIMSRACNAISYEGAGGGRIGTLGTNGGLTFQGNADKKVDRLAFDKPRCGSRLPEPPSGVNGNPAQCQASTRDFCVKNLVDFSSRTPLNWPVAPPPLPTTLSVGTTWNASTDYPNKCILLAALGASRSLTAVPGPPGIYCVSGPNAVLALQASMTAGDGYTFFALNGAKIQLSSNGTSVKFYWPSACGPRPTTRPMPFTCFGRTIGGYDPLTVLYSTSVHASPATAPPNKCDDSAICLNGQGGSLTGDVFAPIPNSFPPSLEPPVQYGGTVWVAGGAASAGNGFIEAWGLVIQGNGASYTGTGTIGEAPQQGNYFPGSGAHCDIGDPPVRRDDLLPDCRLPDETGTIVLGDHSDHCYIGDPPALRDDLLPSCVMVGEPGTIIHGDGLDHCYLGDPPVQRDDLLPSCILPGETGVVTTGAGSLSMDE
jgi:hypothetical protein